MVRRSPRSPPYRTLGELEGLARRVLSPAVRGYVDGGAGAERTREANVDAFSAWSLRPRALRGLREVSLATTFLGTEVRAPFFVAPTAYQRELHPDGERGTARAAGRLRVLGVYSTLSSDSLEAIGAAAGAGPRWFQLYPQPEWRASLALVRRAERAGYTALVLTIDTPVLGSRDRQIESGFALRRQPRVGNGSGVVTPARGPEWNGGTYALGSEAAELSWTVVERLAGSTSLPLVVKGVLSAEEAGRAVDAGAQAVIVSNHGGRQLDRAPASLHALPAVARAVGRRAEVYLDGGVRRGSDVLVALALGARGVGVGRPVLWALAVGGAAGVDRYLRLLGTEVANSMLLLGCASPKEVRRSAVGPSGTPPASLPREPPGARRRG